MGEKEVEEDCGLKERGEKTKKMREYERWVKWKKKEENIKINIIEERWVEGNKKKQTLNIIEEKMFLGYNKGRKHEEEYEEEKCYIICLGFATRLMVNIVV